MYIRESAPMPILSVIAGTRINCNKAICQQWCPYIVPMQAHVKMHCSNHMWVLHAMLCLYHIAHEGILDMFEG